MLVHHSGAVRLPSQLRTRVEKFRALHVKKRGGFPDIE